MENYNAKRGARRQPNQVKTSADYGRIYSWLIKARGTRSVVEFGTAFGVSGMQWLSGLKATGGHLFTFEPNATWAAFARPNLASISPSFTLTKGTFEENAATVLQEGSADVGFIDAILKRYMRPGGIILFDDIAFSDNMRACWSTVAAGADIEASAALGRRVGVVELRA